MSASGTGRIETLLRRPVLSLYIVAGALLACLMLAAMLALGPLPPRVVVMTTGTAGSDYDLFAREYRAILKRSGIDLRLVPSNGGVDNLRRLDDPRSGILIGFAQAGLTNTRQSPELASLGTLFYEPLWFFCRGDLGGSRFTGLRGKKVSIGPEGSGGRALALKLLALNAFDTNAAQFLSLTAVQSGEALLHGQIDAAFMAISWETEIVRRLVASPEITVVSFPRADAYIALFPFLNKVTLPVGVGDLAANRPPADVTLLAPKANLIVRRDLHPAIQYLLLEAAVEIHSQPNIFQKSGQFPSAEPTDLPLSKDAWHFYRSGPPFLQRYLPFWLAVFTSRVLLLLIPVLAIVYPVVHFSPVLYQWSMQRRILRLYAELKSIELELDTRGSSTYNGLARLDRLEERASRLRLPITFANPLYQLRGHIGLVRAKIASGGVRSASGD